MTTLPLDAPPHALERVWLSRPRRAPAPLLGGLAVVLPFAVAAAIAIAQHPGVVVGGDIAFVEQAVADAEHARQLLGSVDRFGVAHLGPAHYYLLAPVYWILGSQAYALAVGSLALAGAAAAAIVVVCARRGGPGFALAAALLVILYLHAAGAEHPREPWGPWAILVPMVLFVVLAAAWAAGSAPALLGALLTGSFIAQTHISTPPTLAAVLLVAWLVRRFGGASDFAWPSPRSRRRHHLLLGALAVLLVLCWVPPLVEQVTGHPGNLTLLYRFLRHPHGGFDGTGFAPTVQPDGQSLGDSISGLGMELSVFPFGRPRALVLQVRDPLVFSDTGRVVLVALYATLATALAVIARLRHDRFALALGVASVVSMATAVASFTHIVGPFFDYLITWTTALPVAVWIGWASLVSGWLRSEGRRAARWTRPAAAAALAGLAVAASGAETVALARLPSLAAIATPRGANPTFAPAAALVRADLARAPGRALLRIVDLDTWPVVAAVGNQLQRHDEPVAVAGAWIYMFGDAYRPTGAERIEYSFTDAAREPASGPPSGRRLGRVGDVAVYRRELAGGGH